MHHQRDVHLSDYQKLRPVQLTNGFLDFDTSHIQLSDESLEGPSSEGHRAMNKSKGTYCRYHANDLFSCAVNLSQTARHNSQRPLLLVAGPAGTPILLP